MSTARPRVSIVYPTVRDEPAFEWFADGLACQLPDGAEVDPLFADRRAKEIGRNFREKINDFHFQISKVQT